MASYGAIQRPSNASTTSSNTVQSPDEPKYSTSKKRYDSMRSEFNLVFPCNIPSSPDAAAIRIVRNLSHFALYYTHFVWIILFITLIPERKVSLICLVIMTYVASLYILLLGALPNSYLLHKVIDKRLMLAFLAIATMVELVVTKAALHLIFTLVGAIPVILFHAVLWVNEDVSFDIEEINKDLSTGELLPLVNDESTDKE